MYNAWIGSPRERLPFISDNSENATRIVRRHMADSRCIFPVHGGVGLLLPTVLIGIVAISFERMVKVLKRKLWKLY